MRVRIKRWTQEEPPKIQVCTDGGYWEAAFPGDWKGLEIPDDEAESLLSMQQKVQGFYERLDEFYYGPQKWDDE